MSDYTELRKLQDIIDKQADRILDLETALREIANDPEYYGQRAQMFKKIALKALTNAT